MNKLTKLHEIKKESKIYEECSDGSEYLVFKRIDGMYSYCKTGKGNTIHLSASTPLIEHKDGYKINNQIDSD